MFFTKICFIKAFILLFTLNFISLDLQSQSLETDSEGFEIFKYQNGDSLITMKKYFICFLKTGPNQDQSTEEAAKIQSAHLAHMDRLANEGKICIAGPFGDDGEIRGIVVYNVKSMEEATTLTQADPAVIAGRLLIEIHPWWAMKGAKLY